MLAPRAPQRKIPRCRISPNLPDFDINTKIRTELYPGGNHGWRSRTGDRYCSHCRGFPERTKQIQSPHPLLEACTYDESISVSQLRERGESEALDAFLARKEIYFENTRTQSSLRSAAKDLAHQAPEDPCDLAEPFSVEDDGNDGHDFARTRFWAGPRSFVGSVGISGSQTCNW